MRTVLIASFLLASVSAGLAADILPVAKDPELKQARDSHLNLLASGGGFEAAGAGPLTELKIPVVGILPGALRAALSVKAGKFESSGKDLPKIEKIVATAGPTQNNYGFFLNYSISDRLQLQCTGSRIAKRAPKGVRANPVPKSDAADQGEDRELITASSTITRYGLVYPCTLYCEEGSAYYCETKDYIEGIVGRIGLLYPGEAE